MDGNAPAPPRPYVVRAMDAVYRTVGKTKPPSVDELHEAMREAVALDPEGHPLDVFRKVAARNVRLMMALLEADDESRRPQSAPEPPPPAPTGEPDPSDPHSG